ncbi:hypothetical protein [Serratia fonticola]|uniref:ParE family toxin-like protein n=1 Tax=Serratia fonticola TaxID=47917 RepID=UPI00301BDFA9
MKSRLSGPRADRRIYAKAAALLTCFDRGEKVYTKTKRFAYLEIRVTAWWRLLSKNRGASWKLMTHATFDNEVNR